MISIAAVNMESCPQQEQPSSSTFERPFRLLVKDRLFILDAKSIAKLSPIFAQMMTGPENFSTTAGDDQLIREIVDESSNDIAVFLNCCNDTTSINENNFATILRLSNKYQVSSLVKACEEFVLTKCNLDILKADQIVTLLVATNEYHLRKEVIVKLIMRIASETKDSLVRLKLSRILSPQLHASIIKANLNMTHLKEIESMNGHLFKMSRYVTLYKRMACEMCKRIVDSAYCDGCNKAFCKDHWTNNKCTSDFGQHMINELRENLVELDWE